MMKPDSVCTVCLLQCLSTALVSPAYYLHTALHALHVIHVVSLSEFAYSLLDHWCI